MSEKRVVVPEGMLDEYMGAVGITHKHESRPACRKRLESVLQWLSENPIVPTEQQSLDMATGGKFDSFDNWELVRWSVCEWQRRMFLAPEPEISEEQLQGMEQAANLFEGLSFGPYLHPSIKIRAHIQELRAK